MTNRLDNAILADLDPAEEELWRIWREQHRNGSLVELEHTVPGIATELVRPARGPQEPDSDWAEEAA